ncbi:hypothetical protein C3L33_13060, partial [Rhododendron williamsianum]
MSCLGCCDDDDMQRASDNAQFTGNNASGNGGYHATEAAPKDTKTVDILPIAVPTIPAAAIKKLDASKQPDQEFLAQVSMVSRLKNENVVELLGYCLDGGLRVLAYEFASNGSLHDILHGNSLDFHSYSS